MSLTLSPVEDALFAQNTRYRIIDSRGKGGRRAVLGFRIGALAVRKTDANEVVQKLDGRGPVLRALAYHVEHIATGIIFAECTTLQRAVIVADELSLRVPVGRASLARFSRWFEPYRGWLKFLRETKGEPLSYRAFCEREESERAA